MEISAVIKILKNKKLNCLCQYQKGYLHQQHINNQATQRPEVFKLQKRVCQEDTISPKLFTAVLDKVFKQLD